MPIMCVGGRRDEELTNIALVTPTWAMYNLLMVHTMAAELVKAALGAWFLVMHKTAAIKYPEYDPEIGKVLFVKLFCKEGQGTKSQEVIAEGLLDLSVLDNPPEIHGGAMLGGRYFNSKNEYMSQAYMNIKA